LKDSIKAELGEPYLPELPAYRESDRAQWMDLATRGVEQRGRVAKVLCDRFQPDFLFVLFRETDRVQHQHWAELAGPHAAVGEDLLAFWRGVDGACAQVDHSFRALGGGAVTLVISDHGHGAARRDFFTNRWLLQNGYLKFRDHGESWRRRLLSRLLLASDRFGPARAVLRPLADRMRGGKRRESFGRIFSGGSSFEELSDRIDWKRTIAFSYPVPEGIYVNRYNPDLTPEEQQRVMAEIRHKLETYPEAHIEVFDPKDIYQGKNLAQAPALLLRVDDMETELRMDFSYPQPMLHRRPAFFYGTGVHRMNGILIAGGEGVATERIETPFSLLDLAPTILEGMGLPIPPAMAGHPFTSHIGGSAA
ncbi:MAG: alkaline phosphatase family protein, partial [Thermoplasmata archaeon]|nr:alkaline phosphatase family protein [Thermoplasmata archaeon]